MRAAAGRPSVSTACIALMLGFVAVVFGVVRSHFVVEPPFGEIFGDSAAATLIAATASLAPGYLALAIYMDPSRRGAVTTGPRNVFALAAGAFNGAPIGVGLAVTGLPEGDLSAGGLAAFVIVMSALGAGALAGSLVGLVAGGLAMTRWWLYRVINIPVVLVLGATLWLLLDRAGGLRWLIVLGLPAVAAVLALALARRASGPRHR